MKQYVALARVSSREQEREGFSLEVQEDALKRYAEQHGGKIVRLFKIAETASKTDERRAFRELVTFAKKNAPGLDGLLFYKVDPGGPEPVRLRRTGTAGIRIRSAVHFRVAAD